MVMFLFFPYPNSFIKKRPLFQKISDKGAAFLIHYITSFVIFPAPPKSFVVIFPIIRQQQIHDPAITFDTILLLIGFQIGIID